ncbi:hypothetical protein LWI28_005235 [Acer negundo]|uniref:SHSP domain-containing protein n=1 Tax=Acer negundo TaxID=4023 RepID=A0AAD5NHU6_ACENE|nr:hypothetical protein LWI28_005235 [Acer negundo]KAK4836801.1 hypothetical protein QYF36_000304 [Acer negundo]
MASSLARLLSSSVLPRTLRSVSRSTAAAQPSSRFFNTNAVRDFDDYERDLDVDRRYSRSAPRRRDDFFSDSFFPFSAPRSLNQILNLMSQMAENPYLGGTSTRRGWDVKETDDGLNLRVDMPGLGKEDVKISVEQNSLIIKGEGTKEGDDEESVNRYSSRIELPEMMFKTDEIKAEMKNGVLKVVVPKVKEEERADVFHVKVE